MSDLSKKIKVIGTAVCVLFAAACIVMAIRTLGLSDVFGGLVWIVFSLISLVAVYVVFAVAKMAEEYSENHKKKSESKQHDKNEEKRHRLL